MNQRITQATKIGDVKRAWHVIDVDGKVLGRVATQIAGLLMGKSKPTFVRNLDCGDYVIIVNAEKVRVTGKKEEQKEYYRYSGYPGGLTIEKLRNLRARRPEEIIMRAVKGMLPQNRLRDGMLKRLKVFVGPEHIYADKLKT
ncbi:MAG: 50S ribosomal protein L13 [Candidatus Levybacteria bacterium]|nr:50S ribosomal protein L13 [Candidatus Levybacteria bacterium]